MNIRFVTGELLVDPNRVSYTQLYVDVEVNMSFNLSNTQTNSPNFNLAQDT